MALPPGGGKVWSCMPRQMRIKYVQDHPDRTDLDVDAPYLPSPREWKQDRREPTQAPAKKAPVPAKPKRSPYGPGSRHFEKQVKDD